jgi:MFS family permease
MARMLLTYAAFVREHTRPLGFGLAAMALSSFGQTFFIAVFGAELRATFVLGDGGFGTIYGIATLASGLLLGWVGRFIDRTSLTRFALMVGAGFTAACLLAAASTGVVMLGVALFLLRLTGQGLMAHLALTTMARRFPHDRGKAMGVAALGLPVGEALLPILGVAMIGLVGWRATWLICAAVLAVAAPLMVRLIDRPAPPGPSPAPSSSSGDGRFWRDHRFLLAMPAIMAPSFITTGLFFHQASLAEEKGWSLAWIAACFVGFALARAWSLLQAGPVIDRIGAVRMLPLFLLPMAVGLVAVALVAHPLAAIPYLALLGLSSGVATTISTAVWTEYFGFARLGEIRSVVVAANVLASAAAPPVMGWLADAGLGLAPQSLIWAGYAVAASVMGAWAK